MKEVVSLNVKYAGRKVGILAEAADGRIAFQYDTEWLSRGFSISPLSLPLENRVFMPERNTFDGLFGVFDDSLPDGWGRLLVDRMLLKNRVDPNAVSQLSRLAIVGSNGMGALEYEPEMFEHNEIDISDYDKLSEECTKILDDGDSDKLDELVILGGSSGGARPKVFAEWNGSKWMIKFPSKLDRKDIGEEEYRYVLCAGKCGIRVPTIRLFESAVCKGYFGAMRYDRVHFSDGTWKKIHGITAGGLLETSHRIPNLDYAILMKLTSILTNDNGQLEEMYRRMCFNVFAHNRDDHAKNFSFQYCEDEERWKLAPAYDLTYSSSIGGEHATTVNGNGIDPGLNDLLKVAAESGIKEAKARSMALDVHDMISKDLGYIIGSK